MSLAVVLQGLHNKNIYEFKRSIVWDIFEPKSIWCAEGWELTYSGRSGGTLYLDDDLITGCSVRRASDNAVRDLYAAACIVPSVIHLDAAFFVADPAFLAGLPDWTSTLPKPVRVVVSADDLLEKLGEPPNRATSPFRPIIV